MKSYAPNQHLFDALYLCLTHRVHMALIVTLDDQYVAKYLHILTATECLDEIIPVSERLDSCQA